MFYAISCNVVCSKDKRSKLYYLILCFVMASPYVLFRKVLFYNDLAQFFQSSAVALCTVILFGKDKYHIAESVILGFILSLCFFIILPSALLLSLSLLILVIIRFYNTNKGSFFKIVTATFLGFFIGLIFFHLFIANVVEVADRMFVVATTVTDSVRGYSLISLGIQLMLFFRNWILLCITLIGICVISNRFKDNGYGIIGGCFFIAIVAVYFYYQKKPAISYAMLLSLLWIICLVNNNIKSTDSPSLQSKLFLIIYDVFLLLAPVIMSIGTNTFIGFKMGYFLLPWAVLLFRHGYSNTFVPLRLETSVVLLIVMLLNINGVKGIISERENMVVEGPLRNMYLTENQRSHFELCDSIMTEYGFKKHESVVYANFSSMMTVCYLEAVNCANYFTAFEFNKYSIWDNLQEPDFIFLLEYDECILKDALSKKSWGWPEQFDKIYVGTPETDNVEYSTERWLYCRRP